MSHEIKPRHLSLEGRVQMSPVTNQALDVLEVSLSALSSAVRLQLDDFQRLQRLVDSPTAGNKKVEQVVKSLLVKSLMRPNNDREVLQDQGPESTIINSNQW